MITRLNKQPVPKELHLPAPNPFIPSNFDLAEAPPPGGAEAPVLTPTPLDGGGGNGDAGEDSGDGSGKQAAAAAASEGAAAAAAGAPIGQGLLRLYHRAELRFKQPKAVVYLDLQVRLCGVCVCCVDGWGCKRGWF